MRARSRRGFAALVLAAIFACASTVGAAAQAVPAAAAAGTTSAAGSANADALPDLAEAKSENILLRFEIVTLGSFPITLFYTDLGFDIYRYFDKLNTDPDNSSYYIPLFNSIVLKDEESLQRLGVALGLSVSVGIADAVIHLLKVRDAKRAHAPPPGSGPVLSPIHSSPSP
jgi:hypothetical protein